MTRFRICVHNSQAQEAPLDLFGDWDSKLEVPGGHSGIESKEELAWLCLTKSPQSKW